MNKILYCVAKKKDRYAERRKKKDLIITDYIRSSWLRTIFIYNCSFECFNKQGHFTKLLKGLSVEGMALFE